MNGDPPIDQATDADEQEFLERQGFAPPGPLNDHRRILAGEIECTIAGHSDPIVLMEKIEHLARRIAIDMLASNEFLERIHKQSIAFAATDAFRAKVMEIAWPELSENRRYELLKIVGSAEHHQDPTYDRAFLESSAFRLKVAAIVGDLEIEAHKDLGPAADPMKALDDSERAQITDPADVKEEIIEIDEAGKATVVEPTVHTKATYQTAVDRKRDKENAARRQPSPLADEDDGA